MARRLAPYVVRNITPHICLTMAWKRRADGTAISVCESADMEFGLWEAVLLAAVGTVAGFLNVMAGGGSLLTVPVMVFMGLPGPVANGTNRLAILVQNFMAITAFFQRGFSDFRLSLTLAACAIPGAIVGAMVGVNLDGEWFNRILAIVMVAVMIIMYFDKKHASEPDPDYQPTREQLIKGHLLMVGVGFWGGFIQLGVGFIIMPVLHRVMGWTWCEPICTRSLSFSPTLLSR